MKLIKKTLTFILIIIILVLAVVIAGGWGKYKQAVSLMPLETAATNIKTQESFTPIDEISKTFVNAIVAVEDRRFYKHKGIDFIGIIRAMKKNFEKKTFSEGGSSITQQLAKNIYFMGDDSLSRKIAETFVANDIEKTFTKNEILELYFNVIYYGSGNYNIADASKDYFGKKPDELTDYEATILAGLPNAPSAYSLNSNPTLAKKRQKTVVEAMVSEKYITREEADKIISMQEEKGDER